MGIDRRRYMDADETRRLRESTEARAALDLQKGRRGGVLSWMVVDLALGTGLRVGEIVKLKCGDFHLRRKALTVWRTKRRRHNQETIAIGNELRDHLTEFLVGDTEDSTIGHARVFENCGLDFSGIYVDTA